MRYLFLLTALLLIPDMSHAQAVTALFGTQRFAPAHNHLVTGPLVQLQTNSGATLSFQQGAQFRVEENGDITLASGNLRIGPVAQGPINLTLPQGPITVTPNTALTVTADDTKSTGRIYHGEIIASGQTFTQGQGFVYAPSGPRGTFSPAAAQAPAYQPAQTPTPLPSQPRINLATVQSPSPQPDTPLPTPPEDEQPTAPEEPSEEPATETPAPQQPAVDEPAHEQPTPEEPAPEQPVSEEPVIEEPVQQEPIPQPEPEIQPEPQPEPQPQPQPEPEVQLPPTPVSLGNMLASFSQDIPNTPMPDHVNGTPSAFRFNAYTNGLHTLQQTETTTTGLNPVRLSIGTALNQDAFSLGTTAGLGRWVGGELVHTASRRNTLIQNFSTAQTEDGTTTTLPHSLHYVWGENATNVPTLGRVTYALAAATQPTYTGNLAGTAAGSFTGSLAIDFTTPVNDIVGTYHFNGMVTMPQTVQTETGPATVPTTYHLKTDIEGGSLSAATFTNPASLIVTAPTGAAACPTGCRGTVNAAGFGNGMAAVGTLYNINPTGETGITGAALFTTTP